MIFSFCGIEAFHRVYERLLQRNLDTNRAINVDTYNVAVMDTDRPVPVLRHDAASLGGTTDWESEAGDRDAIQEATFAGCRLGDIVPAAAIRVARLISIDIQGAELLIMKGMRNWFDARVAHALKYLRYLEFDMADLLFRRMDGPLE